MKFRLLHIPSGLCYKHKLNDSVKYKSIRHILHELSCHGFVSRYVTIETNCLVYIIKRDTYFELQCTANPAYDVKDYEFEIIEC